MSESYGAESGPKKGCACDTGRAGGAEWVATHALNDGIFGRDKLLRALACGVNVLLCLGLKICARTLMRSGSDHVLAAGVLRGLSASQRLVILAALGPRVARREPGQGCGQQHADPHYSRERPVLETWFRALLLSCLVLLDLFIVRAYLFVRRKTEILARPTRYS